MDLTAVKTNLETAIGHQMKRLEYARAREDKAQMPLEVTDTIVGSLCNLCQEYCRAVGLEETNKD
jgi:hypothetical protein